MEKKSTPSPEDSFDDSLEDELSESEPSEAEKEDRIPGTALAIMIIISLGIAAAPTWLIHSVKSQ